MVDDRYRRRDEHGYDPDRARNQGRYKREFYEDRERYGASGTANEADFGDDRYQPESSRSSHEGYGREGAGRMDEFVRRGGSHDIYGRGRYPGNASAESFSEDYDAGSGRDPYGRDHYPGDTTQERYGAQQGGRRLQGGGDLYGRNRYPGNASREGYAGSGERFGGAYGDYPERFAGGYDDYGRDLEGQAYGPSPRSASSDRSFGAHRGRGPRGYTRSDERIREDVNDRLSDDGHIDASDIEVSVSNCEVTLSGTVSDRSQKRRAEDLAEAISGVLHVQNNIRVNREGINQDAARRSGTDMSGVSTKPGGTSTGSSTGDPSGKG